MLDFLHEPGRWGGYHICRGRGCPVWIYGCFIEVQTIYPISGTMRDGNIAYGIAGPDGDFYHSFVWTWRSRMLPAGHPEWRSSQPIDLWRIWLPRRAAVRRQERRSIPEEPKVLEEA